MAESVTELELSVPYRSDDYNKGYSKGWDAREPEIADMRRYARQLWDGITDLLDQSQIDRIERLYREELDVLLSDGL